MSRIRRAAGVATVATLLAVVGVSAPAQALPSQWSTTDFYSDATYSQIVGTRFVNCSNPVIVTQGQVTNFRVLSASGPC